MSHLAPFQKEQKENFETFPPLIAGTLSAVGGAQDANADAPPPKSSFYHCQNFTCVPIRSRRRSFALKTLTRTLSHRRGRCFYRNLRFLAPSFPSLRAELQRRFRPPLWGGSSGGCCFFLCHRGIGKNSAPLPFFKSYSSSDANLSRTVKKIFLPQAQHKKIFFTILRIS